MSVDIGSCGPAVGVGISQLACCTRPVSAAGDAAATAAGLAGFVLLTWRLSPGSVWCEGGDTIGFPLRGSNRQTRQIFRCEPPTSSHGSQKL